MVGGEANVSWCQRRRSSALCTQQLCRGCCLQGRCALDLQSGIARHTHLSGLLTTYGHKAPTVCPCACAMQMLPSHPSAASRTTSDAAAVLEAEIATVDRLTRSCSGPPVLASHSRQGRTPRSRLGRGARQGVSRGRRGHRRDAPRPTLEGFLLLLQACQAVDEQPASRQRASQPDYRTVK